MSENKRVTNSVVLNGLTYQNIVPEEPTLRNSVFHKYMQRFNYGYDNAIVTENNLNYMIMYGDTMINIASERRNSYIGDTVKQHQTQKISQEHDIVYISDGLSYDAIIKGETLNYILPEARFLKELEGGNDEDIYFSVPVQSTEDNQVLSYTFELKGSFVKDTEYTLFVPCIGEVNRSISLEVENGELQIIERNNEYILFSFNDYNENSVLKLTQKFSFENKTKDMIVPFVTKDAVIVEGNYFDIPLQILDGGLHGLKLKDFSVKTTGVNLFNINSLVLGHVDEDGRIDDEGEPFVEPDIARNYMRSDFIQVMPNKSYDVFIESDIITEIYRPIWNWFDKNHKLIKQEKSIDVEQILTAVAPENAQFVIIQVKINNNEGSNINLLDHVARVQLKESSARIEYQSYRENTIYFTDDIELNSLGDICDELDLNRSVITRRVKKVEDENGVVLRKVIDAYEEPVEVHSTGNIAKIDINKYVDKSSWDIEKLDDGFQIRLKALEGTRLADLVEGGYFKIESNNEEIFYKENIIINEEKDGILYAISVKVAKDTNAWNTFTQDGIDDMELYYIKWMNHILPHLDVVIWHESKVRQISNVNELLSFEDGYLAFNPIRRCPVYITGEDGKTYLQEYENSGCNPVIPTMRIEMPARNAFYLNMLRPNTYYTLSNYGDSHYVIIDHQIIDIVDGSFKTPEEIVTKMVIYEEEPNSEDKIMIVEGNHAGKDIPLFDRSLSVSNPEINIIGRNLFDYNKVIDGKTDFIKVQPNVNYIKFIKDSQYKVEPHEVEFYTLDKQPIPEKAVAFSFTTPKDACYIKFAVDSSTATKIQLEQRLINGFAENNVDRNTGIITGIDFVENEYSETKVNIGSYTMRAVGPVRDIYDIQNGLFTKNVEEIQFSEEWEQVSENKNSILYAKNNIDNFLEGQIIISNDRYASEKLENESCVYVEDKTIYVRILKDRLEDAFANPVNIFYAITPEIINNEKVNVVSKENGTISVDVESSLLPLINYEVVTENSFHIDALQCNREIENYNKEYTLRWDGDKTDNMTFTLDGIVPYDIEYNGIITIPNTINKVMVVQDINGRKPMLIVGNVKDIVLPNYFTGIRTSSDDENEVSVEGLNYRNTDNISLATSEYLVVDKVNNRAMFKRKMHRYEITPDTEITEVKEANIAGYTHVVIPFPENKEGINNLCCDKLDVRYFFNEFVFIDDNGINLFVDSSFVWNKDTFANYLDYRFNNSIVLLYELKDYELNILTNVSSVNVSREFPYINEERHGSNKPQAVITNKTPLIHVLKDNEELKTNAIVKPVLSLRGKKYKVRVKPDTEYTISFKLEESTEDILHFDLAGNTFEYNINEPELVVIKTPEVLQHNYLYIKGGRCKISEVTVVEDYVSNKYFETINSVGLFEDNQLKISSDEGFITIDLPTDLRSVGSVRDMYLPDNGLVKQFISKMVLDENSSFADLGIEDDLHKYRLNKVLDAKINDVVFYGKLLPDLKENCSIEEDAIVIRYSVFRNESFTDFLRDNNITVYYAKNTPDELSLPGQELIFETENFECINEVPAIFKFRSNAYYTVNLVPSKKYIISCVCNEDNVTILFNNTLRKDMVKDIESNLFTCVLSGEEIGNSFTFETELAEIRNIMVTEEDSLQPFNSNMISGVNSFDINIGSLNLIDIDNAELKYSDSLTVTKENKVIHIENPNCKEGCDIIKIPFGKDVIPLDGYYIASLKLDGLKFGDTNRINHKFTIRMIDQYGDIVGSALNSSFNEEGILESDPFLVCKGNYITGIVLEDTMELSNDSISLNNSVSYNISEVCARYFERLEDVEEYVHEDIAYVEYTKVPINIDRTLHSLSDTVYDYIDYQHNQIVRQVGVCKLTASNIPEMVDGVCTITFDNVITDSQIGGKYIFSSLPVGSASDEFSCAYFDYNTGRVTAKIYQHVTSFVSKWLEDVELEMLYQLDTPVVQSLYTKPNIQVPVKAGITTSGAKVKPILDWCSEQINVNISSSDVYTVVFEVLSANLIEGNVFIGPNVTRNYQLKLGTNRVAVKIDPNTINDCTYVELDFPSVKIGQVMVLPGDFESIENGDQLYNILYDENGNAKYQNGIFESVSERENNNIVIHSDSGADYILENLNSPLRGLPNQVFDEINFDEQRIIKRVGIFNIYSDTRFSVAKNVYMNMYEVTIDNLNLDTENTNIGASMLCNKLPVIDKKFNPTIECITNSEGKLQILIPFKVFEQQAGANDTAKARNYINEKDMVILYQIPDGQIDVSGSNEIKPENVFVLKDGSTTISGMNYIPAFIQYKGIDYTFNDGIIKEDTPYTIIFTVDSNLSTVENIKVSFCNETREIELLEGVNNYKVVITPDNTSMPTLIFSAKDAIFSNIMVFEGDFSADNHTPTEYIIGKQSVGVEKSVGSGIYSVRLCANDNEIEFLLDSPLRRIDDIFDSVEFDLLTRRYYHIKRISDNEEILEKPIYKALDVENCHLLLNKGEENIIESAEAVKAPFVLSPLEYHVNVKPSTKYKLLFVGEINSTALKVRFNGNTIKTIRGTGKAELYSIPFTSDSLHRGAKITFEKVTNVDNMLTDKIQFVRVFEVTTHEQREKVEVSPTLRITGIQSTGDSGKIDLVSYDSNLFDINAIDSEKVPSIDYMLKDMCLIRSVPLNNGDTLSLVDSAFTPQGENGCVASLPHILPGVEYTLSFDLHSVSGIGYIKEIAVVGYLSDDIDETDINGVKIATSEEILPITPDSINYTCTFTSDYEVHGLGFVITMGDETKDVVIEIEKIQLQRGKVRKDYESCNKVVQEILVRNPLRSLPNGKCDLLTDDIIERKTAMVKFNNTDWNISHTEDGFTVMYANINTPKLATPVESKNDPNSFICNIPVTYDFAPGIVGSINIEKNNDKYRLIAIYNGKLDLGIVQDVLDRYPIILIYEIDDAILRNKKFMYTDTPHMEQQIVTGGELTLTVYDMVRPFITADIPADNNIIIEEYRKDVKELKEEVSKLRDLNETIINEYKQYVLDQTAPIFDTLNVLLNHSVLYNYAEDEDGEQLFIKLFGQFFLRQLRTGITTIDEIDEIYNFKALTEYLLDELGK